MTTVGITGHRTLGDAAKVREDIREALKGIAEDAPLNSIRLLSALAAGADQLAAQVVVDEFGGTLEAILPLEPKDYATDFLDDPAAGAELHRLLARATRVSVPDAAEPTREAAYEAAGRAVVDGCEVLLACWNGKPARGRGGTAEIVEYARRKGRRVTIIHTE
jgi:hypothetical protein